MSHWEPTCQPADMTLFECKRVHVIRAAASTADDKVTRGVKAAYKQACPFPDRKLGAAEALPCLICQRQPRLMVCTTPCWTAVLISACVTHLLLVTLRCARLRAKRDRGKSASHPSVRFYKQGLCLRTGQHGTHHVEGQEAL